MAPLSGTVVEGVAVGSALAWAIVADRVRAAGGTYADGYREVCRIRREAGRDEPSLGEYDQALLESEDP